MVFSIKEELKLSSKNSLSNTSSFSFKKTLNARLKFKNYNEYYWNEKKRVDNIYNSLRLTYKISNKDNLNYLASISSNNSTSNLKIKDYSFYIAYKHYLKEWLYIDIVPKVYLTADNFKDDYKISVNIGIIIGK